MIKKGELDEAQAAMKRRHRRLPTEFAVTRGQLANPGGRFYFRLRWQVRDGRGVDARYVEGNLASLWSAGSTEEMLHAVAAAELALAGVPGVKQETGGQTSKGHKTCGICGRRIWTDGYHDINHCRAVRLAKAAKKLVRQPC